VAAYIRGGGREWSGVPRNFLPLSGPSSVGTRTWLGQEGALREHRQGGLDKEKGKAPNKKEDARKRKNGEASGWEKKGRWKELSRGNGRGKSKKIVGMRRRGMSLRTDSVRKRASAHGKPAAIKRR